MREARPNLRSHPDEDYDGGGNIFNFFRFFSQKVTFFLIINFSPKIFLKFLASTGTTVLLQFFSNFAASF